MITSLACFTLQSGALLEATGPFYVGTSDQGANVPSGNEGTCSDPSNTTCQFLDACYEAAQTPGTFVDIIINVSQVTYSATPTNTNVTAYASITSSSLDGTIINFNGQGSGSYIFQPTYDAVAAGDGSLTLGAVILEGAYAGSIDIAGGSLTLQGTTVNSGSFNSNLWSVQQNNGLNPSLIFAPPISGTTSYSAGLPGDFTYVASNTTLNITNNSGSNIQITGNFYRNDGGGSALNASSSSGDLYLTGSLIIDTLTIQTGSVYLEPASGNNTIGTLNLASNTNLYVNSSYGLGAVTSINVNTGSSLVFEGSSSYTIPSNISYAADGTTFTLENSTGMTVEISGDINNGGFSGSNLTISPTSGNLSLTGSVAINTLNSDSGTTFLFPNTDIGKSNTITTVNIGGSNLRINSNQSFGVGAGTTININDNGELTLNNFTATNPFGNGYTINLNSTAGSSGLNQIDDGGYITQIAATIAGIGTYYKQGNGIQTLTQTNTYEGGTVVGLGTLAISDIGALGTGNSLTLLAGAGLYVSQDVTIPSGTSVTITSTGGSLSATTDSTLTIAGPITASGTLQIGTASSVTTPNGTVSLTNTSNSFSGNSIIVGTTVDSNNIPATLSALNAALTGLGSLTLQYGGEFQSDATDSLTAPIYIGSSGSGTAGGIFSITSGNRLELTNTISLTEGTATETTVHVYGPGILALTGTNSSFQGSWAVENYGFLEIGSTTNLGMDESSLVINLSNGNLTITGNVDSQRTLQLYGSDEISVASLMTASFSSTYINSDVILTKIGDGTLSILPSTQSYIPVLNVSRGTFIGNTLNLANTPITVSSGATVEFYQVSESTFIGAISGAGYVSITGTAPLTFSPTSSSYTGGTLVSGPLIINQDVLGAFSAPLFMENGGSLTTLSNVSMSHYTTITGDVTFSQNPDTILQMGGSFAGTGTLSKYGTGALVLSGNSPSYTGKIYVNEGALVVNGNFRNSGDPTVAQGTILAGTGTVGDTDVFGTIKGGSPSQTGGSPIGTLTINGPLILENGSNFGTVISPSGHSLVTASGLVTIDHNTTLFVGLVPGSYSPSSDLVILSGSNITGTFAQVSSTGSLASYFFTNNLRYTPTEVTLAIVSKSIVPLASGQNAINVATALDDAIHHNRTEVTFNIGPGTISASSPPELPEVLFSLLPYNSDPTAMTYALNELHPAQLKGMAISQESNMVQVREALSQRMQNELDLTNCELNAQGNVEKDTACKRDKKTMTPWISAIGESLGQNTKNNSWGPLTGYRANMGGFGAGIDGRFANNFYAGALTGYTHSHLHWKSGKGQGDISSGYAGLYASGLGKMFYGNASIIGSWSEYSTDRHIEYGFINKTAKNSHGGSQILSHLDTGINWNYLDLTIRPFDGFDYISQTENSYTENNAGEWNLHVQKNNEILIRNELGLQLAKCFCMWNSKWTVSPKLSWVYESRVKGDQFTVNFVDGGTPFVIEGYFPDRSLFAPGLVMTGMMLEDALAFNLYYNGEFGSGYSNNTYGAQVRYAF